MVATAANQNYSTIGGGGSIAQWLAYLLPDPAGLALNPSIPKLLSEEKIVNVAEVNQQRCFEESGQRLENVD